ncbi:MAG: PLP-dependent transferase [Verrucomicrobiaceae bacterium]|nr:PLP-dependent transferase [Verrucomicrobiaceae bacterium]
MTDLLKHPLWREETLGTPLPDNDNGVSVSLPLWRHVIGYEEKDPAIVSRFRSGYPRFCCPPAVGALFDAATREHAGEGERCLVFPREIHAARCIEYIRHAAGCNSGRVTVHGAESLGVAVFPADAYDVARRFWRFCGEVVSTRQACDALGITRSETTSRQGAEAQVVIRERLASLSGQASEDVFLFPSGMAATFAVHRMLTSLFPARKTIQLDFPYVDVLKLQQQFGSGAHFFPLAADAEYDAVAALLAREKIAGIFCEAPSNPLLRCVDFARVRTLLARTQPDVPLVVDDTIATVANVDAFRVADVVTTSLTKAFSGAGDLMAGSVILNRRSDHHAAFSAFLARHSDHELWRGDAVALELNSRDFAERASVMSRNSTAVFEHLRAHPKVARAWHSSVDGGAGYRFIQRRGGGHGCLVSIVLRDAARTSPPFYDALRMCKGPSLGTHFSLACPYVLLAHYDELDWAESCGADRHLIRISAGLEPLDELVARLDEALGAC